MHFEVRVGIEQAVAQRLRSEPALERLLAPALALPGLAWIALRADSAPFDRLIELTCDGPGMRYTPYVRCTPRDLAEARWLVLQPAKLLPESRLDGERNRARLSAAPWVRNAPGCAHRVLRGIALTRVKLRPAEIGTLGEWTSEFVLPSAVRAAFEGDGLRGFATLDVRDGRDGIQAAVRQLDTPHVLPQALPSAACQDRGLLRDGLSALLEQRAAEGSAEEPPPADARCQRLLGCPLYADFDVFPTSDFARTAEAFDAWGQPLWAISSAVYSCYVRHALRGWQFRPLLERGSQAHGEHERHWRALADKLAQNPRHRLW